MKVSRDELLLEYDRLSRLLVKAGGQPVVSDAALEVFTTGELAALVKDAALTIVRLRRLEA